MRWVSKFSSVSAAVLVATYLAFLVGCGAPSSAETSQLHAFVADLNSKGFTVTDITVVSDPVAAAQLTVIATDAYAATLVQSRLAREAALARARGDYPYGAISVRVVDSEGRLLAQGQETIDALPASTMATNIEDSQAAQAVRDYLALHADRRLDGLSVSSVVVETKAGERTLQLTLNSSDEGRNSGGLDWLIMGATSEDGWIGDLNGQGLGLSWVEVRVTYTGLPDSLSVIDVARRSVSTYSGGRAPDFGPRPSTTVRP